MRKFALLLLAFPVLAFAQTKPITFEDIYRKGTFRAETVPGFNSMQDGRYYTELDKNGNLLQKAFATGETVGTLINAADVKDEKGNALSLADIEWSNTEKQLLIFTHRENIYRRSTKAYIYAYDVAAKKAVRIDTGKVMHATFSPDGTKVAFVKNNNLFYKNLSTGKTVQVTKDGKWNFIINGNCDWVYEEEFSFTRAFEWSKQGNYLAYYKFDESKVPQYQFAVYDSLYPKQYTYKYPKAGQPNSVIEIHLYQLATAKDVKADIGTEKDIYIPRIQFTEADNSLGIIWLNRLQNHMKLLLADATTGKTQTVYEEKNKYYVDVENSNIQFLNNGIEFIYTSEKDGYRQIYLHNLKTGADRQLTLGRFEVTELVGVDEKNSKVYFMSNGNFVKPLNKFLCSVPLAGGDITQLQKGDGIFTAKMSADFSYYLQSVSGMANIVPQFTIVNTATGATRLLKDNAKLAATIKEYGFATPEFITVPGKHTDSLNGWMLKPANFDASKKYPVIFCNYGGPGSQQVLNRFGTVSAWHQYMAQHGLIVVCVDNTGTGGRGEEFKKKTYLQLGKLEIEDQINAAQYIGSLPYVDKNRIGHWGWSFGGFMSSLAITKGADVFKLAVAGAPVTSWRLYDDIYTERYMRTPQENAKGYDENAPLNFVKNIKGKFLIVHGTADDNVHYQNSVMMVDAMIKNDIQFESAYYPNKAHGIRGGNADLHVYRLMTQFILNNL